MHVSVPQAVNRYGLQRVFRAGLLALAVAGAATACGGGGTSVAKRNAEASPAVAYKSGAGFVAALRAAGVPCPKQSVDPVTTATSLGVLHVADSVSCTYSKNDYFSATVAWSSKLSSKYFSFYFEAFQKACRETSCEATTLKGKLWFAHGAPDVQRLYDAQKALGGQLTVDGRSVKP